MTPEMAFECLLVSQDPAMFDAMGPILQNFSIYTNVCSTPSRAAAMLAEGSADLVLIDLESEHSESLMRQLAESSRRQKPTIVGVSAVNPLHPGIHVILRKPITPESAAKAVRAAYSRMLQDYRKHTRFGLMTPFLATDDNNRIISGTVTNIGEGGVGLTTQNQLEIGTTLYLRVPLMGSGIPIHIRARVLWTRQYGAVGCEFVRISPCDLLVLHAWLESRYRFKKPLVPV